MTETISTLEGAKLFVDLLERHAWKFSLTAKGELHRSWATQTPALAASEGFAVLEAMAPEIIALLAARDGLDGLDGGRAIH